MKSKNIILIGPVGVGKTTIARELSKQTGIDTISLDEIRYKYYSEIKFSSVREKLYYLTGGFKKVYKYWKPFEAYAVKRVVEECNNTIIDFGAGHSDYDDKELLDEVKKAFMR